MLHTECYRFQATGGWVTVVGEGGGGYFLCYFIKGYQEFSRVIVFIIKNDASSRILVLWFGCFLLFIKKSAE